MSKSISLTIETQTENDKVLSICHVNERVLALDTSFVANKMFKLNRGLFARINKSTRLIGGTLFRQEITRASMGSNRLHVPIGNSYESKEKEISKLAFVNGTLKKQKRIETKSGRKVDFLPSEVSNDNVGGLFNASSLSPDDIRNAHTVCTVEEIYLFQDKGIKSFLITDNLQKKRSLVEVGYRVEMIIKSDFKEYVEYVVKESETALKFLTIYLNSLSYPNIYDNKKIEFKEDYQEKVFSDLGISLEDNNVDLGQPRVVNSEFGKAASAYYNLASLLSPSVGKDVYSRVLRVILPTNKTTPESINSFLRNFNSILETVRFEYFANRKQTKKEKGYSKVAAGTINSDMVEATSKERLELEEQSLGYSVFSDAVGMGVFSGDSYRQRLVAEQMKYYPKIEVSDASSFLTKEEMQEFSKTDNAPAFLTPSSLIMGKRRIDTNRGMNNIDIDDIREFRMTKSVRQQQRAAEKRKATKKNKVTIDSLSSLNVTISGPKLPILSRSIVEDMDPLIDAKHYVGNGSTFTTSNPIALLKNFRRIQTDADKRILSITADIIPRRFLGNRRAINSIKEIQFTNPNSIVRKLALEKTLSIKTIPPQIKFMMSKGFAPNPDIDPLKNSESREIIEETVKNLFMIKAHTGFRQDQRGFLNVHAPIYRQMDSSILSQGRPVLAKASHYEIPELGIVKDNFLATIYSNLIYVRG